MGPPRMLSYVVCSSHNTVSSFATSSSSGTSTQQQQQQQSGGGNVFHSMHTLMERHISVTQQSSGGDQKDSSEPQWVAHLPPSATPSSTAAPSSSTSPSSRTAPVAAQPALEASPGAPYIELDMGRPAVVAAVRFGKATGSEGRGGGSSRDKSSATGGMKQFRLLGALDKGQFVCDLLRHQSLQQQQQSLSGCGYQLGLVPSLPFVGDAHTADSQSSGVGDNLEGTVGTLKNDHHAEVFSVYTAVNTGSEQIPFPCRYIRLLPLNSWGDHSTIDIWSVELIGWDDPDMIATVVDKYRKYAEKEAVRLCLKFFRQSGYSTAFEALLQEHSAKTSGNSTDQPEGNILEHELLSQLYTSLVLKGDFEESERILQRSESLLQAAVKQMDRARTKTSPLQSGISGYEWKNMRSQISKNENASNWPPARGGHQMVIDEEEQVIYLYGGWNGRRELGDLWKYDVAKGEWELLFDCGQSMASAAGGTSSSSSSQVVPSSPEQSVVDYFDLSERDPASRGGLMQQSMDGDVPGPRSCHKMVLCAKLKRLYIIGYYLDARQQLQLSEKRSICSDFFYWDIRRRHWVRLSNDTLADGGPPLTYDHQVCIDEGGQRIYMFGGQIVQAHVQQYKRQLEEEWQRQQQQRMQQGSEEQDDNPLRRVQIDSNQTHGGLYVYDIQGQKWTLLRNDNLQPGNSMPLRSRLGHSMVFDAKSRNLVIFGGMRGKEVLGDLYLYNVDSDTLLQFNNLLNPPFQDNQTSSQYPAPETHQITFDPDQNYLHVFTTVKNDRRIAANRQNWPLASSPGASPLAISSIRNTLWLCRIPLDSIILEQYRLQQQQQQQHYQQQQKSMGSGAALDNTLFTTTFGNSPIHFEKLLELEKSPFLSSVLSSGRVGNVSAPTESAVVLTAEQAYCEPCPRFAYQFIYDSRNKVHYLFGGNPGDDCSPDVRFDDFWSLRFKFSTDCNHEDSASMSDSSGSGGLGNGNAWGLADAGHDDDGGASVSNGGIGVCGGVTIAHSHADHTLDSQRILQHCCYLLRRQQFLEMCQDRSTIMPDMMRPLYFLREHVRKVVDESNPAQVEDFRRLASVFMFPATSSTAGLQQSQDVVSGVRRVALAEQRMELYNRVLRFFPAHCKQPSQDLTSLAAFCALR